MSQIEIDSTYRLDQTDERLTLRSMELDEDTGFLRITGVVAADGTLEYPELGFVERVDAEALADPEGLASLKGAPLVRLHPDENGGRVDVTNVSWLNVGTVISARYDAGTGEQLFEAVVTDASTIEEILEAKDDPTKPGALTDVSPGYQVLEKRGDMQVKRKHNHLALVPRGRGERARIYLDAAPNTELPSTENQMENETDEVQTDAAAEMQRMREDMDKMREQMDEMHSRMKPREDEDEDEDPEGSEDREDEGVCPSCGARADAAPAPTVEEIEAMVDERLRVKEAAAKAGIEYRADASTLDNMRAVVQAQLGDAYRADSGEERTRGMFDVVLKALNESKDTEKAEEDRFDSYGLFVPSGKGSEPRTEQDYYDSAVAAVAAARNGQKQED